MENFRVWFSSSVRQEQENLKIFFINLLCGVLAVAADAAEKTVTLGVECEDFLLRAGSCIFIQMMEHR